MGLLPAALGSPYLKGETESKVSNAHKSKKLRRKFLDFPGGAVVKNPPANAGDTGSSPGPGSSHMLWSS